MFEKEEARLPVKNLELQGVGSAYGLQETRRPENKVRSQWAPQGRAWGCTLPASKDKILCEFGIGYDQMLQLKASHSEILGWWRNMSELGYKCFILYL